MFDNSTTITDTAENILRKRYYKDNETTWEEVANRVVDWVALDEEDSIKESMRELIANRYFIPNSPCLVNSGVQGGGLSACYVVDFKDTIEDIYATKLNFALIARKGGGCGTTLSKLRPEGSKVAGSTHGYSAGPVNFFNTICHDMEIIAQGGFRAMAMMGTMTIYHPDIVKFIAAKESEGKMSTTNISVVVDDAFMENLHTLPDSPHVCKFGNDSYYIFLNDGKYSPINFKDITNEITDNVHIVTTEEIFNLIVDGAWKNGEPGLIFYDKLNSGPYSYSNQEILATNPCGEQGLPPNGVCNLGSLDISKFLDKDKTIDLYTLEYATRLGIRFLDDVASRSSFPTVEITEWVNDNRPVGLGIMGLADYYLKRGVAYGSEKALEELEFILSFIKNIAEDESQCLGEERGIPLECSKLPIPRRNITVLSIAPTGTISLLAGCNSSIEPFFSETTIRNDKTGTYELSVGDIPEHFRCAVSSTGNNEVSWDEHVRTQASAQKFVDSGVSKTINFPNNTSKGTIASAFILAHKLGCKGITVYRNGSRALEVLSPKLDKVDGNHCPVCKATVIKESGCTKCSSCDWSVCSF